jgi:hypothetical protein
MGMPPAAAVACVVIAVGIAPVPVVVAQDPSLSDVLSRLDAHLARYETLVSAVVAEERYEQRLELARSDAVLTRVLRSDYALARSAGGLVWTGYRDTFEVDGRPVRDREPRLLALLTDGSAGAAREAFLITRENARLNLGEDIVTRTINVPTVALDIVHPRRRERLRFTRRGSETIDGADAWALAFEERDRRGTILRTPRGGDRRVRGGVWIDPRTGEVLRTDLSWDGDPPGFVRVDYRRDANVGALVPATMTEEYRADRGTITGTATYTNYRRFQTDARIVEP